MYDLIKRPDGALEVVEHDEEGASQVIGTVRTGGEAPALRLVRLANVAALSGFTDEELEVLATTPPEVLRAGMRQQSPPCRSRESSSPVKDLHT